MKRQLLLLSIFLITLSSSAFNKDSLWTVWNDTTQADTNRFWAIHEIIWSDPSLDTAIYLCELQYGLAKKTGDKKLIAKALYIQGLIFYYYKGNSEQALKDLYHCLNINEELRNKNNIANCFNAIGNIYKEQSDFEQALIYQKKNLEIR